MANLAFFISLPYIMPEPTRYKALLGNAIRSETPVSQGWEEAELLWHQQGLPKQELRKEVNKYEWPVEKNIPPKFAERTEIHRISSYDFWLMRIL